MFEAYSDRRGLGLRQFRDSDVVRSLDLATAGLRRFAARVFWFWGRLPNRRPRGGHPCAGVLEVASLSGLSRPCWPKPG